MDNGRLGCPSISLDLPDLPDLLPIALSPIGYTDKSLA